MGFVCDGDGVVMGFLGHGDDLDKCECGELKYIEHEYCLSCREDKKMTQEIKHTPAPWFSDGLMVFGLSENHPIIRKQEPYGTRVHLFQAICPKPCNEDYANARHIVKCVNIHDEMLSEMEKLAQALEDTGHEPPQSFYDVIKKARGM